VFDWFGLVYNVANCFIPYPRLAWFFLLKLFRYIRYWNSYFSNISLLIIARAYLVFFLVYYFLKMKLRREVLYILGGLRGAVPIVFATYPLLAGIEKAI